MKIDPVAASCAESTRQRGAITAELAVVLPVVLLLLGVLAFSVQLGLTQLRFDDAARAAARQAARGEAVLDAVRAAQLVAGPAAQVSVLSEAGFSVVSVSGTVAGPVGSWLGVQLEAKAVAKAEFSAGEDAP